MIIESLLDTDLYKIRMTQWIWTHFRDVEVEWALTNRTKTVLLAKEINLDRLRYELDNVKQLHFRAHELEWLKQQGFRADFIKALFDSFVDTLSPFKLTRLDDQFDLSFKGKWWQSTLWEVPALAIICELRSNYYLNQMTEKEISLMYSGAEDYCKDWLNCIYENEVQFGDFGTRRRHSKEWQDRAVQACMYKLGDSFLGTSNCALAKKYNIPCLGTLAHEIPMVMAALAEPEGLIASQYDYLPLWAEMWPQAKTLLPDTYGTVQFFKNAPRDIIDTFDAVRIDSMEPHKGIACINQYWNPEKTKILSDGLTFDIIYDVVCDIYVLELDKMHDDVKFMMGTNLSNPFAPQASIVIKVLSANGRPALKLSDNHNKITGDKSLIDLYIKTFGTEGVTAREVNV